MHDAYSQPMICVNSYAYGAFLLLRIETRAVSWAASHENAAERGGTQRLRAWDVPTVNMEWP